MGHSASPLEDWEHTHSLVCPFAFNPIFFPFCEGKKHTCEAEAWNREHLLGTLMIILAISPRFFKMWSEIYT